MVRRLVAGVAAALVLVFAISGRVVAEAVSVYDNTTNAITGDWTPDGFWPFKEYKDPIGDQVTLEGSEREVTQFGIILSSTQLTSIPELKVWFYDTTGTDAPGAPGSELWWSTADNVSVNGPTSVSFNVPHVLVPDTFIWIASAGSSPAGLATYDPPTVGSSEDDFWDHNIGDPLYADGKWYRLAFHPEGPVANFGAWVLAVPEPTTFAFFVLGALSVVKTRRPARRRP